MEDVLLVIPTHARPTRQITYSKLTRELQNEVVFVVSEKDDAKYIATHYPAPRDIVIAKNVHCCAEKRHWIMNNIQAHNIFMMDDDLQFFHRCHMRHRYWNESKGAWNLYVPNGEIRLSRIATAPDLNDGFSEIFNAFGLYGAVGMSFRRHNDKVRAQWRNNERLMFAFGINKKLYKKLDIRFDRGRLPSGKVVELNCREDFHITLELLRRGVSNAVYYELYHNPGDFGAPGGASTDRTLKSSNKQAHLLAQLHPGFVKAIDRQYDTSPDRTEVIVQWKKAYESSQRKETRL